MTAVLALLRALVALVPLVGPYLVGRAQARQKAKIEGLEGYRKTREAIDNVESVTDPDLARKRLRERNPKQH